MLSLATIFGMLSNIMHNADLDWHNHKQITLFLKVPTTEVEEKQLLSKVVATTGVANATLRTATDALMLMQDELDMQNILGYLPENPLPAAIDVIPSVEIDSTTKLTALYKLLESYATVESAKIDIDTIKRISLFLAVITNIFKVIICLIVIALVLVISNALHLVISDRVDEIKVLKFIGASNKFIRRPYVYIGILYGVLSALLTIFVVNFLFLSIRAQINQLLANYAIVYTANGLSVLDSLAVIILALLIGWFGASFATRRYLNQN